MFTTIRSIKLCVVSFLLLLFHSAVLPYTYICIVACFFLIHSSVQCVFTGGVWMWVCMRVCLELKNGSRRNCTVNLRFIIFQLKSWAHICSLPFSRSFCFLLSVSFAQRDTIVADGTRNQPVLHPTSLCNTKNYIVVVYIELQIALLLWLRMKLNGARWHEVVLYGVTQHPNRVPSTSKSNGNKWRTAYVVRKRKEILEVDSPSNMFQICFNLCAWICNWKQINCCL